MEASLISQELRSRALRFEQRCAEGLLPCGDLSAGLTLQSRSTDRQRHGDNRQVRLRSVKPPPKLNYRCFFLLQLCLFLLLRILNCAGERKT